MIKNGARPTELDSRDYSFNATFGSISPLQLSQEYNVDASLTMPDQNADGNPFSCTGYSTCELGTNQDGVVYSPEYTYMKTLFLQNLPPETNGSDMRPSLKSAKVFGLLPKENVPEILKGKGEDFTANHANWPIGLDAISGKLEHRKANYFNVYDDGPGDWFDAFRSALWLNREDKRSISLGTPWFYEWAVPQNGKLTPHFIYNGPSQHSWHNWVITGWKMIDGEPYLMGKSLQGRNYGDNGWCYVSRETINKVMEIRGSVAFTLADARPEDVQTIQLGIWEVIVLFFARLVNLKRLA